MTKREAPINGELHPTLIFTPQIFHPSKHHQNRPGSSHGGNNRMRDDHHDEVDIEILKAVAQAWHGHSANPRPWSEFEAHRREHRSRPTRFKVEAMKAPVRWNFEQSLWDSYEIVTLCKKLESSCVGLEAAIEEGVGKIRRRRRKRESKKSLRSLFQRFSSKRFEVDVSEDDGDDFHSPGIDGQEKEEGF